MHSNPPSPAMRNPVSLAHVLGLVLAVVISAWLSLTLARLPGHIAAVWISNGLIVGWLLARPTTSWRYYLVPAFAAEVLVRQGFAQLGLVGLVLSASNLIEVLSVAGAVRRLVPDIADPRGWLQLGSVATASTLIASALSGALATPWVGAGTAGMLETNFLTWYAAHVVGMVVVVATFTLVVHLQGLEMFDVR